MMRGAAGRAGAERDGRPGTAGNTRSVPARPRVVPSSRSAKASEGAEAVFMEAGLSEKPACLSMGVM